MRLIRALRNLQGKGARRFFVTVWIASGRAVMTELWGEPQFRLGSALAASVLGHALVLSWPVSLSPGGSLVAVVKPPRPALQVSLKLAAHVPEEVSAPAPAPVPAPEPATDPTPQQGTQGTPGAMVLPGYYPAGRLTRMPEAVGLFDIQPPEGGDSGEGGKITLRIWISVRGGVDSVRVLSSGLPANFAQAALDAFSRMRFAPGEISGVPVQSWVDVVIEYADFRRDADSPGK